MKFGRRLLELEYEPWKSYYVDYEKLKNILEDADGEPSANREREFVRQLNREIEKTVLFFLQEQGQLASRLSQLHQEERQYGLDLAKQSEKTITRAKLRKLSQAYRDIGEDLVHLIHFVELCVTAVRKILKKHDKLYKRNKLFHSYLSEHFWDAKDSHLLQLLHYEGIGAMVTTLQDSFIELHALELILLNSLRLPSNLHRRTRTEPVLSILAQEQLLVCTTPKPPARKQLPNIQELHNDKLLPQEEPILLKIEAARQRLRESSEFVTVLATSCLAKMDNVSDGDSLEALDAEDYPLPKPSRISSLLNLLSTFLYMSNYYIVAPTSGAYAAKLGSHEALAGLIIGMTPMAALVSTILYSWWTNYSYKTALIFASSCLVVGNLLYALGLPCHSMTLVMLGRLLNGFGSARSINRRYIADAFSRQKRTAASAAFVTAGALGMAVGPAMAAFLDLTTSKNVYWSSENAPGWFMFLIWLAYLIALIFYFRDPPKLDRESKTRTADIELVGEKLALLSSRQGEQTVTAPPPLWQNIPVMTTLVIYCVLKLALESCLSSTATLTAFYFDWGAQASGVFLAVLGLLMFPANLVVAYLSRRYDDRELIMALLLILAVGAWGIINYGLPETYSLLQYITFAVCIFVSATALEGPNMSLLSKLIPKHWAKGLFNVGLLATEAGTLGRVIADVFITYSGLDGISYMLNRMFISLGCIVALTVAGTYQLFPYLEPYDRDDY